MKITNLSLVAALALGASAVNAKPLMDAIKDVDVNGTVAYRYNDYESGGTHNIYQINLGLSSKVNEYVKFNSRFTTGTASLNTSEDSDNTFDIGLTEANFSFSGIDGLNVIVGKQSAPTPWTVARDYLGDEQTGTGMLAIYAAGPATFYAGWLNQTNWGIAMQGADNYSDLTGAQQTNADTIGKKDVYVAGVVGNIVDIVTADAFYANMEDSLDSYTLGLNANFKGGNFSISPFARYTTLDPKKDSEVATIFSLEKTQSLWQIGTSANMGIYNAFVAYGKAGKDGGVVSIDASAQTGMDYHWRVTADGTAKTEYLYVNASADVTDKITAGLYYSSANYDEDLNLGNDYSEVYTQVSYQMSKNLSTYVRFGEISVDNSDEDGMMGRLQVLYSF